MVRSEENRCLSLGPSMEPDLSEPSRKSLHLGSTRFPIGSRLKGSARHRGYSGSAAVVAAGGKRCGTSSQPRQNSQSRGSHPAIHRDVSRWPVLYPRRAESGQARPRESVRPPRVRPARISLHGRRTFHRTLLRLTSSFFLSRSAALFAAPPGCERSLNSNASSISGI